MRLALGAIHEVTDEKLKFAKQLGVEDIIVHTPELRGEGYWEFLDLLHLRMRVESAGLRLAAICLLYTSPSPRDKRQSRMPSSA